MRKILWSLILGALFVSAYYVYPYWTLGRIYEAFREHDVVALEGLVDWPRLREGMKNDTNALFSTSRTAGEVDNGLPWLAA